MAEYKTHGFFYKLALRWIVCSLGLWIAAGLLGGNIAFENGAVAVVTAGLILAIVNSIIKPLIVLLAFPAIMLTLGLFMIVVNGLMVMLASALYSNFDVSNIWTAMLAGLIIGLVNYLVTAIVEER